MRHISESIIGRKGVGPFRSMIIVPMESDHMTFSYNISYVVPFNFGADNIWSGFATTWDNAEDIYRNIILPQTMIFVSGMPMDDFIKEFTRTNKHSRYVVAVNAPKDHLINPPKGAEQITSDELREIVRKYR